MATFRLILGDQLFYPLETMSIDCPIIMIEHRDLCANVRYHKLKIAFFFSAMRHYRDALIQAGFNVCYIPFDPKETRPFTEVLNANAPGIKTLVVRHIVDASFRSVIDTFCLNEGIQLDCLATPMFLNTSSDFEDYLGGTKKPFMKTFYEASRKRFNILLDSNGGPVGGQWSYDADNRKKCPLTVVIPKRHIPKHDAITLEVIGMVNDCFETHIGDANDLWLPITRGQALAWWHQFKHDYFQGFGDYEDAIDTRDPWLFHSGISALLNIGLLTPNEVIDDAIQCLDSVPINALEGFVRQVMGWREFIRGIYDHYNDEQSNANFWGATRLLNQSWYKGDTGHLPLDDAIKGTMTHAYQHHIGRLMVLGSTMMCCDVHPNHAYQWFMECFVDGAEWVMGPNVYGMSQFSDGGIFATKPYLCGSNYIRKMSHYGNGEWCDIADGLYWRFIGKHRSFFEKNYRMRMAVSTLAKMPAEKQQRLNRAADAFIDRVTES
jgi:deoxyribodipyrimidine photolyase-related protein